MPESADRGTLESIERLAGGEDCRVQVAFLAARAVRFAESELNATRRRALLVLAAGGDPHRPLELDAPAVRRLARELDSLERRIEFDEELRRLGAVGRGLPAVEESVDALMADPELAWHVLALVLIAEELAEED